MEIDKAHIHVCNMPKCVFKPDTEFGQFVTQKIIDFECYEYDGFISQSYFY